MKISIKNDISYLEIEAAYKSLSKYTNVDLYIPSNITGKQLGVYSELIQLIITWSRRSTGKLYIHYNSTTEDLDRKIEVMFNRYWNFVAAAMGYNKGIFLLDGTEISSSVAKIIKEKVQFLKVNQSWKKGDNTFIPSIQHSANPYPSAFYLSNGILKSKKEFIDLSKNVLLEITTNHNNAISTFVIEFYTKLIGEILYELIENTHFWSQSNFDKKQFATGIRGLIFSTHHGTKETLLKNCKDDQSLHNYISNAIENDNAYNYFVEVSIFDTGAGLASKWSNKDINDFNSKQEIYEAIIDCLIKKNTSDNSSSYERGFGLHNMMTLLGNRGYLKLRTNGLKLFRNFREQPFNEYHENDRQNYQLQNWHTAQGKPLPKYKTNGTLFSIFLPIQTN